MNCIRLGTDNSITVHKWPDKKDPDRFIEELIGKNCYIFEPLHPVNLFYHPDIAIKNASPFQEGGTLAMMIDPYCWFSENNDVNVFASWFMGADRTHMAITGNVVFCWERCDLNSRRVEYSGLKPDMEEKLLKVLKRYVEKIERSAE